MVSADCAVHDATVSGAARSDCGISWNAPLPSSSERRMAGDEHHRRLRGERGVERAERIGVARTAGDERDARLAGEPAPGVGHVHRRRLVPHVDERELRVERGIEHRHHVVARQREHVAHAGGGERARKHVGAAQAHARALLSQSSAAATFGTQQSQAMTA